jgi:hypothetical protein
MNTDSGSDARLAENLPLNYLTLRIHKEPLEKCGIRHWPTFVVIDQRGVVRDAFAFSRTLEQEIGDTVRQLLAAR